MKRAAWMRTKVLGSAAGHQFILQIRATPSPSFSSFGKSQSNFSKFSNIQNGQSFKSAALHQQQNTNQKVISTSSHSTHSSSNNTNTNGNHNDNDNGRERGNPDSKWKPSWRAKGLGIAGAGGVLIGAGLLLGDESRNYIIFAASPTSLSVSRPLIVPSLTALLQHKPSALTATSDEEGPFDRSVGSLPTYRKSQVAQHDDPKKSLWVTYKRGVFDVTEFISQHPGGDKLLMAAGGSLEGFWDLYPVHKQQHVFDILAQYRIGNLHEDDVETVDSRSNAATDAFRQEPRRNPLLLARSLKPFNGETPKYLLAQDFHTPNEIFYIRNHLPVPEINLEDYQLEIDGLKLVGKRSQSKTFTLEDIKKLPKKEISATIQCGGNRRSDMNKWKPVTGLGWAGGAIGNARWAGASLHDVLKLSGFSLDSYEHPEKLHIQFEGFDSDPSGESYGASIPLSYLLDSNFQPILAYEMNGETLPHDHGYPLRIILPGIVGARNVKWLSKILISEEENQSPWQQRDYKVFSPSVTLDTVDYTSSPSIQDTPVTSYICSHEDGQVIPSRTNTSLKGYAFSGGGRDIIRVEISTDQGKTWTVASSLTSDAKKGTRNWSWVLWESNINFPQEGDQEIWVKAVDSGYNQQPESFSSIWNYRGLVSNAYHKINLKIQD